MKTIALIFSLLLLLSSVYAVGQDQASAPVFKDGDFWHFKITEDIANVSSTRELDGVYELIYSNGAVKVFHLPGGQKTEVALDQVDRAGVFRGLLGLNPKRPDLKFPLYVGQRWTYSFEGNPIGSRVRRTRNVEVRVIGIEQVNTQAGAFRAFKIIAESDWTARGRGAKVPIEVKQSTSTHFYSPDAKSIVKTSGDSSGGTKREIELIKFGHSQ